VVPALPGRGFGAETGRWPRGGFGCQGGASLMLSGATVTAVPGWFSVGLGTVHVALDVEPPLRRTGLPQNGSPASDGFAKVFLQEQAAPFIRSVKAVTGGW
jgi:hypothetical protein